MSAESSPLFISTDSALLDVPWMVRAIQSSYWGGAFTDEKLRRALEKSLVFGAYRQGFDFLPVNQIGLLRVVTDGSIFSSITDVFVEESERGKGVGSALMDAAMASEVGGTYCILRARQIAWLFYFKWGFRLLDDSGVMAREPV